MGNKSPKTIGDLAAMGLDLALSCRRCGREAVFDGAELLVYAVAKKWPLQLPLDTRPFPCRCGARDPETRLVMQHHRPEPLPPRAPTLQPLYVSRPSAIDVLREAAALAGKRPVQTPEVRAALDQLARWVDQGWLDAFWNGAGGSFDIGRSQQCRASLQGILRQL